MRLTASAARDGAGRCAPHCLATLVVALIAAPTPTGAAGDHAPTPVETDGLCYAADSGSPILASVYSLPSDLFTGVEAERFVDEVARLAPARDVVVLTDLPISAAPRRHLVATGGDHFSPWPRDPFSLAWSARGELRVVVRPNVQPGREADSRLGEAFVRGLPAALRRAWREPRWTTAAVPFHNGQLLLDDDALRLSLHSVEPRTLELLGLDRVPVASFATPPGAVRYAAAARRAADELSALVGRPARFVHPLPTGDAGDADLMTALGGGAGFDLDSLLTLLAPNPGPASALVADLSHAEAWLPAADDRSWGAFGKLYGLAPPAGELRARLVAAAASSRARALDRFVDLVAAHLAGQGLAVGRLPALLVPVSLLARPELTYPEFAVGWNNVVVERRGDALHAEGFASGLAPLDAEATRRFAAAGARLSLLPSLAESVIRNGGYRCASNHVRQADCRATTAARDRHP